MIGTLRTRPEGAPGENDGVVGLSLLSSFRDTSAVGDEASTCPRRSDSSDPILGRPRRRQKIGGPAAVERRRSSGETSRGWIVPALRETAPRFAQVETGAATCTSLGVITRHFLQRRTSDTSGGRHELPPLDIKPSGVVPNLHGAPEYRLNSLNRLSRSHGQRPPDCPAPLSGGRCQQQRMAPGSSGEECRLSTPPLPQPA